jgi:hypothetical protein
VPIGVLIGCGTVGASFGKTARGGSASMPIITVMMVS